MSQENFYFIKGYLTFTLLKVFPVYITGSRLY